MFIRFYRRIPLIPGILWLNISKGGLSLTTGTTGRRITANKHGVRLHLGWPGTGLGIGHFISYEAIQELLTSLKNK